MIFDYVFSAIMPIAEQRKPADPIVVRARIPICEACSHFVTLSPPAPKRCRYHCCQNDGDRPNPTDPLSSLCPLGKWPDMMAPDEPVSCC